ncbi:agmatine deiminase family protein [Brevundimonas sp. 2R-24]|uniref:Agmatine deiminase family protein n=1 Tax=Peiella sedimenti TaxID=3061083 RepID=A0ABT8SLQ3_9CAUL|nr:agmatine deiminase family protein [Caulobacteraceae bacterium XZ-24]
MNAPAALRTPAEWESHAAMWLGFPSAADLWLEDLGPAQEEVAALARVLAGPGQERVRLLVCGEDARARAEALLGGVSGVEIVPGRFGDIWLRDTGPIFVHGPEGPRAAGFRFNGWGGKYELPGDDEVAEQIADHAGAPLDRHGFILEGGAVDHNGQGVILTTRQCLLNRNRNTGWTSDEAEAALAAALGARRVIWLQDGLLNDHTDGHVDNLARFVGQNAVLVPQGTGMQDPNFAIYEAAAEALEAQGVQVLRCPSPGRVTDEDDVIVPASFMNFIIANGAVIVPEYEGAPADHMAEALKPLFPDRRIVRLPSDHILTGGGSFHCITQQEIA